MLFLVLFLNNLAIAGEIIVANNTRISYDFGHNFQPYIANEIKFVHNFDSVIFEANKFRVGFRYKTNDHVRIDPHLFIDNKRKDEWVLSPGPAIRLDITF